MEYRQLGNSGLRVPVLSFGTATFGGGQGFQAWGSTQVDEAKKLINLCLDAGVNLFDTSNIYSAGASEEILGKAMVGLRDKVLISTKATFPMSKEVNDYGSSRINLIKACEDSLKRLGTDHIDIYHMHGFDATHPCGGNTKNVGYVGAKWQGEIYCLFQFFGLAPHEIVVGFGAVWLVKICGASSLLFLAQS